MSTSFDNYIYDNIYGYLKKSVKTAFFIYLVSSWWSCLVNEPKRASIFLANGSFKSLAYIPMVYIALRTSRWVGWDSTGPSSTSSPPAQLRPFLSTSRGFGVIGIMFSRWRPLNVHFMSCSLPLVAHQCDGPSVVLITWLGLCLI